MRVRNRIRELRFAANEMTQQQLADAIGVTRQAVNAIVGAKYSPTPEDAFAIAETLGVRRAEAFQYDSPKAARATRR